MTPPRPIPFMRLDRQYGALKMEMDEAVARVFAHGRVLQGPEVAALEEELASLFGLAHGVAVGSGTDALILALKAAGLQPGGRVALTSLSFVASASAVVLAGGRPLFVDIDPFYQAQPETLLELIQRRAIDGLVAVHLYGQMMDLDEIYAAARGKDIFVIEDAAQCLGASRLGRPPGRHSDLTCLSFDPTKVVGAQGSGGMVLTDDEASAERLGRLRYHGHVGGGRYAEIGFNSQLATLQAALLSVKLRHAAPWQARRSDIAARYTRAAAGIPGLSPPQVMAGNVHNFHKYVLRVGEGRDRLREHLAARGVETRIHYPLPLHRQPCFAGQSETAGDMPRVEAATREILSLPIYAELSDEEVALICAALADFRA